MTIDSKRTGWTFITITALTLAWYALCPFLGAGYGGPPSEWKRTSKGFKQDQETTGRFYYRNPYYFWPGVAVIWPLTIGLSILTAPAKPKSEQDVGLTGLQP